MEFRTVVHIEHPKWQVVPAERILFVGSCFADRIGHRFADEHFPVTVNPYGVMYNPVSILHTLERMREDGEGETSAFTLAVLTLGTNHVYVEKKTGEIVDNCQKRPQQLFEERELSVDECADTLERIVSTLKTWNPDIRILLTVSPIRYQKYGFHGSQLSKATLLLAVDRVLRGNPDVADYFPAYEIVNDELRDYRFYNPDMLHPSEQTVEYIWQRMVETYFSDAARKFLEEWQPIKQALGHRPFNPDSVAYQNFKEQTARSLAAFDRKYGLRR